MSVMFECVPYIPNAAKIPSLSAHNVAERGRATRAGDASFQFQ